MKTNRKFFIIVIVILAVVIINISSPLTAHAHITNNTSSLQGCPIPRVDATDNDKTFIDFIEKEKNISIDDENVSVNYNGDGTTSVNVINNDGSLTIYSSLSSEQKELLKDELNSNKEQVRLLPELWRALVWLLNAYEGVKTGCEVIKGVSGYDVCGYITKEAIKSLVEYGKRKKFKEFAYLNKKPCPYPPHSQTCNNPPFAYIETRLAPC